MTLVRKYDLEPMLFVDDHAVSAYLGAINAKDEVGLIELEKRGLYRNGKQGTTALMMGTVDVTPTVGGNHYPCCRIRIKSGPEKDQIMLVLASSIDVLIPTRVKAGETGVLAHDGSLPLLVHDGSLPSGLDFGRSEQSVNVYDRIDIVENYRQDRKQTERDALRDKSRNPDVELENLDMAYVKAGKLLILPIGVRVKVINFGSSGIGVRPSTLT